MKSSPVFKRISRRRGVHDYEHISWLLTADTEAAEMTALALEWDVTVYSRKRVPHSKLS